jgi:MFS family permease
LISAIGSVADADRNVQIPPLNWGIKIIMLCGGLLTSLAMIGITAVLPQIEVALAHSAQDRMLVKLLVTGMGLTMVIGAPLAGFLVDRFGLRRVLLASCLLYSLAGTSGLYLDSLSALFASRLLLGLTAGGLITMSMTLISTRLDGIDRAKWMGANVSTTMAGTIVIHPLVGYLGEHGWRWPFALYALGLLLAVVAALGIKEDRAVRQVSNAVPKAVEKLRGWFPFRYAFLGVAMGIISYVTMVYIPFVIRAVGVSSPTTIALIMLAESVIGAVVALLFGRSQRYLSSRAAFIISFTCTGIGALIVATASTFSVIVVGLVVFGFGMGWFIPNLMTASVKHIDTSRQGRAIGIIKGANFLAAPMGTVLVEPVTRMMGPTGAMWAVSALSFVALGAFVIRAIYSRRPFELSTPKVAGNT